MMLSGQCKEDFEVWLLSTHKEDGKEFKAYTLKLFYDMPYACIFGVIQDFADSKRYEIYYHCDETILIFVDGEEVILPHKQFKTRTDARTEAVKQFNTLYNER